MYVLPTLPALEVPQLAKIMSQVGFPKEKLFYYTTKTLSKGTERPGGLESKRGERCHNKKLSTNKKVLGFDRKS